MVQAAVAKPTAAILAAMQLQAVDAKTLAVTHAATAAASQRVADCCLACSRSATSAVTLVAATLAAATHAQAATVLLLHRLLLPQYLAKLHLSHQLQ